VYAATKNQKFLMIDTEPDISAEDLAAIKVPTVVIAGSRDLIKKEETQRIADSIPGAKLRILQGHGHMSYINSRNVLADLIIEEAGK
jgi:pimeloyl-ACP methyl ester carboxylesterase